MWRLRLMREGWSPPPVHINVISSHGGMGDMIARIPAIRHGLQSLHHLTLCVWWPDYFLDLAQYLLPGGPRLTHRRLSEAPYAMAKPLVTFDPDRVTSLSLHLTTQAFLMLYDQVPPSQEAMRYPRPELVEFPPSLYLKSRRELLKRSYVVFTVGFTSRTRQWPSVHINRLAVKVREAGLEPVLLGTSNEMVTGEPNDNIKTRIDDGIDKILFTDLTNKTTLVEALGIMQRAKAVVGVDNGLLHLAHCTAVPIVYGLTTLKAEHRIPFRNSSYLHDDMTYWPPGKWRAKHGLTEVITAQVPCNGCQSRGTFINHDWRTCLFDDYACTLTLTADRFFQALRTLGVVK